MQHEFNGPIDDPRKAFDTLNCKCVVADRVELARLTQIMNLLNLAPDIQEQILHLPRVERGRDPATERDLRPIAAVADWRMWRKMQMRGPALRA